MARYSQPFELYHQSPALESKPTFSSEDDEMSVLDDKILDATTPDITSINDPRRTSYDDDFSRRESVWTDFSHQSASTSQSRSNSQVSHALFDSTNPFARIDAPHGGAFPQHSTWNIAENSGSCTPTQMYEHFPQDYDGNASAPYAGGAVGPVGQMPFAQMPFRPGSTFGPAGAVPMSPQSSQGWISTSSDAQDNRARPVRSPTFRNGSPLHLRRDGIRKKNARFEIPAERNLGNIDFLISQSTDDNEIKELKQQKRLLRNRQAALDSRQRKKQHTEKLEEEKKQFSSIISELEEALQEMKIREAEHVREKNEWIATQQQVTQYIDGLGLEKEELVRKHTLETADLRRKNGILREHIQRLENSMRPANTASTYGDFTNYDQLPMDGNTWEDFSMVNELNLDNTSASAPVAPAPSAANNSLLLSKKSDKAANQSDYPFSWNAFYMCLLFGAFIASNSSSVTQPSIPQLSDEYRAESANVLKAVLESVSTSESSQLANQAPSAPNPSASALPTTISGAEMAELTSGASMTNLDSLHNSLAAPSREQEHEQAFSLSADQYNSLTTFNDDGMDFKAPQPSNLEQAFAAMRRNGAQNALGNKATSAIHSRSLLWERVPEKVVRDFKRMVGEYGPDAVKQEGDSVTQS